MESIAVTKPDMRIERQETLSPFGFLNQVFAEELIRRNSREVGYYRPMRLAYLEEETPEADQNPPDIRFDLDVDLIVNRLLKAEKGKDEKEKKEKTPAQRILERVILREKEIRVAYPETRRLVIEGAGRRVSAELPLAKQGRTAPPARSGKAVPEAGRKVRQDGEGRSTGKMELLRPSAALARPVPGHAAASAGGLPVRERKLPLASQAMSVPAAGGWKPTEREAHPGYPGASAKAEAQAIPAGSILLPDVMRRRREEALERRERAETPADGSSPAAESLSWLLEGTQETPETERVFRELRRAVSDTLRRNLERERGGRTRGEPAEASEMPGQGAVPTRRRGPDGEGPAKVRTAPPERTDAEAARRAEAGAQASRAASPAEPTYREKETEAGKRQGEPGTARGIGPAEESFSGAAVPEDKQAPAAGEAKLREAGNAAQILPAAMAAGAPGPDGPAELVYREDEETDEPAAAGGESSRPSPERMSPVSAPAGERPGREERITLPGAERGAAPAAAEPLRAPVSSEEKEEKTTPAQDDGKRGYDLPREALPTALPPEGEEHTAQGAALVYRESGGSAAPEMAAPAGRPGREEKTEYFAAERGRTPAHGETPPAPVSHEDDALPGPAAAEPGEALREEAAREALPTALPPEGEAHTAQGAALVYRESGAPAAPEAAAPAGRSGREEKTEYFAAEKSGTPARGETPPAPVSHEDNALPGPMASERGEALREEAAREALPTALPQKGEEHTAQGAALIYREERETDSAALGQQPPTGEHPRPASGTQAGAREAEISPGPAVIGRRQAAAPGETTLRDTDGRELRRPSALPREEAQEAASAEMIHPEGRTPGMPGRPAYADAAEQSPRAAGRDPGPVGTARSPGASAPGGDGTGEGNAAGASAETETPAAPATAVPAQEAAQAAGPSELRYLTERENAAETPGVRPSAEPDGDGQKTVGSPPPPRTPGTEGAGGRALPRGKRENEAAAGGAPPAWAAKAPETGPAEALPAGPVAEEAEPASLIYREAPEGPAPRPEQPPRPAGPDAAAGTTAGIRQSEAPPSGGAAARSAGRRAATARENEENRGAPAPEAPIAIPAETHTQRAEQAALVYREASPEDAGLSREGRTPVPPTAQGTETPRPPEIVIREIPGEGPAAALPGPQEESGMQPVGLQLRAGEAAGQPGVMGSVVRDIRLAAERGQASRAAANRAQRTENARRTAPMAPAQLGFIRREASPAMAAPAPETAAPEPAALVFAPLSQSGETGQQEAPARPTQKAESGRTGSLPPWAQELLEKAGVTDTAQQAAAFGGNGAAAGRQISWTAPAAMPAQQSRPAAQPVEMTFKDKGGAEETAGQPRISDAEIQRTADKVYRIIEERLRRELRRSGR